MVRSTVFILVIGAMFFMFVQLTPAIDQTTSSDVSKQTKEAWETFKAYMAHQKDEAVADGKMLLKKADEKIQELEADAAKSSGDAKVKYEKTIKKLKEMHTDAAKKLDDLGNSSTDAWDSTKDGFVEAYKDLHDTYKEAAGKFK
jgi:preprotein translocase subunit SecF